MTYARARLWLGITGVGSLVLVTTAMLVGGVPHFVFPDSEAWSSADLFGLAMFVAVFVLLMLPFDLLGGYFLPRQYSRSLASFSEFLGSWAVGVAVQSMLFVMSGLAILAGGRIAGLPGASAVVLVISIAYLSLQKLLASVVARRLSRQTQESHEAISSQLEKWGIPATKIVVADHADLGFTGGVVGWPGNESVIIPRNWVEALSPSELATVVARRLQAVASGSRLRGLVVSLAWILCGFAIATTLPNAGVRSVAQLVTTCCAFTCWMFIGLLILPSLSRLASYANDRRVVDRGVPEPTLATALRKLDQLQDDEPNRPAWVERIFHPVPSLENRSEVRQLPLSSLDAWHTARTTLYLSWSCLGLLSRAVHCNAGRPELWVLLPTD